MKSHQLAEWLLARPDREILVCQYDDEDEAAFYTSAVREDQGVDRFGTTNPVVVIEPEL